VLVTSAAAKGQACPVCGAAGCTCGPRTAAVPSDAGLWQEGKRPMAEEQVQVEHRPGQSIKLDRKAAEAFVRDHPGARILGDKPAAKAVRQADVEDKAVPGPRAARGRTGRPRAAHAPDEGPDEDGD
jgi:hypothetical protein